MKSLFLKGESTDLIMTELEKLFTVKKYDANKLNEAEGLVFDLNEQDTTIKEEDLVNSNKFNIPILLLNSDSDKMEKMFGIGFQSRAIIATCHDGYNILRPIDVDIVYKDGDESFIEVQRKKNGEWLHSPEKNTTHKGTKKLQSQINNTEIARVIENEFTKESLFGLNQRIQKLQSLPSDLPQKQVSLNYIQLKKTATVVDGQTAVNDILMEVSLIASFNPKCKYLKIRSLGAGCHPSNGGGLKWDGTYNRGFFQKSVNIHMEPLNNKLTTYQTSPMNVNGQTSYSEGSSFTIGVNVAKEPSFNASYTISEQTTATISDFDINNDSSGLKAYWGFEMGITNDHIRDIFDIPYMKKPQVKSLPNLAKKNIQPHCESVWRVDDNPEFKESVGFLLNCQVFYYHCWVTGNWAYSKMWVQHKSISIGFWNENPMRVYFDKVSS